MELMVDIKLPSALAQFNIAFEYDLTWAEARRQIRARRRLVKRKKK